MLKRFIKNEEGQSLVLVALFLVVILGIAAYALDGGNLYLQRAKAVNITDASALAGAAELPDDPDKAIAVAKAFGVQNGMNADDIIVTIREDHQALTVNTNLSTSMLLAGVLGIGDQDVPAKATASVGIAASVPWIVPFVIPRPPSFNFDELYVMRMYGPGSYPSGYDYSNDYKTDPVFSNYPLKDIYNTVYKDVYYTKNINIRVYTTASTGSVVKHTFPNKDTKVTYISTKKPGSTTFYEISFIKSGKTEIGFVRASDMKIVNEIESETLVKAKNIYPYQFDYMNVHITTKSGHTDYIGWLKNGYHETFRIWSADNKDPKDGIMYYYAPSSGGKESVDAFATRLRGNSDYTKAKLGDPRVMLIPVVNNMLPRNTVSKTQMKIIGFVGFFLEDVHKNSYGESFWFTGRFLDDLYIGAGEITFDSSADFGLRVVGITE